MGDEVILSCAEVNELLKAFLEDLLEEKEYQAVVFHIEHCATCREYASSVGSLSNHIRQLGNIEVPADFADTVIFKLSQQERRPRYPLFRFSDRQTMLAAVLLFTLFLVALTFKGFVNLKKYEKPIIAVEMVKEEKSELQKDTFTFNNTSTTQEPEQKPEEGKTISQQKDSQGAIIDAKQIEPIISEPVPLHWHFAHSDDKERTGLLEVLRLLDIDIKQDYQRYGIVFFSATGKQIEASLEKIFSIFPGVLYLRDFSSATPVLLDKKYQVALYFENKKRAAIHWHIDRIQPEQRTRLSDSIVEMAGSIDYKSERLIAFSIPKAGLKKLMARIQAMRLAVSEFGSMKDKENLLTSAPVEVSIYFI